jgi:hypothetical protein
LIRQLKLITLFNNVNSGTSFQRKGAKLQRTQRTSKQSI